MNLLNPLQVDDRHHTDAQVDVLGHIDLAVDHHAVQAFVEEQVGALLDLFPGGELARLLIATQAGIVLGGLFRAVQVVALLAAAGFAIGFEQFGDLVEVVGLRTEMAQTFGYFLAHFRSGVAMEAVTLDYGCLDAVSVEDVLEGTFDGRCTGAGRAGNGNHGMFFGH